MMRKHIMLDRKKEPVKAIRNNTKPNNHVVSKDREQLVVLTMDNHLTSVITEIGNELSTKCPGLSLRIYAASDWASDENILDECRKSIKNARLIFVSMLFMEEHFKPILEDLKSKRDNLDALVCIMSSPEVTRLTKMGRLDMSKPASGVVSFLKRFRNKGKSGEEKKPAGEAQMRMLRSLPKILKYIPGTAQDLRVFFLSLAGRGRGRRACTGPAVSSVFSKSLPRSFVPMPCTCSCVFSKSLGLPSTHLLVRATPCATNSPDGRVQPINSSQTFPKRTKFCKGVFALCVCKPKENP